MDRLASPCPANIFGIWLSYAIASTAKKTEESCSSDQLASGEVDIGERRFLLNFIRLKE